MISHITSSIFQPFIRASSERHLPFHPFRLKEETLLIVLKTREERVTLPPPNPLMAYPSVIDSK